MKLINQISKIAIPLTMILLTMSMSLCSSSKTDDENKDKLIFKEESPEVDNSKQYKDVPNHLVLIYDGGHHRNIKWDTEHFKPYVSDEVNGKEEWMFDGFLFLEIHNGQGRGFASGYQDFAARKIEWKRLLENYFREGNAIHALNEQIGIAKGLVGDKDFTKRKIVISVPEPIPSQTDWGKLDNRTLIFSRKKDRLDACKWYIDYAEELFEKAEFENVELVGFYWLAEEATNSRDLARDVAHYVYAKEYDFYWIPYFFSDGYNEWRDLGFNAVYYQPNYFFNEDVPYERLQQTIDRAKKNQMSLEIEFDERALKNNKNWGYRLHDYLDVYEKNGVFNSLKVAYYQGGDAFYRLSVSKEPEDVKLYNRLKGIIKEKP